MAPGDPIRPFGMTDKRYCTEMEDPFAERKCPPSCARTSTTRPTKAKMYDTSRMVPSRWTLCNASDSRQADWNVARLWSREAPMGDDGGGGHSRCQRRRCRRPALSARRGVEHASRLASKGIVALMPLFVFILELAKAILVDKKSVRQALGLARQRKNPRPVSALTGSPDSTSPAATEGRGGFGSNGAREAE